MKLLETLKKGGVNYLKHELFTMTKRVITFIWNIIIPSWNFKHPGDYVCNTIKVRNIDVEGIFLEIFLEIDRNEWKLL